MKVPRVFFVTQTFPDRRIKDIPHEVRTQLESSRLSSKVKPRARIAIGAGSRGIANIATIMKAVVDYWRDSGCHPFIVPAMGSHGAATAEGQGAVLAHYGIDSNSMGCPVISSLDVISLGRTQEGIETFLDRNAYESEGVMLVGRVKWHTDFEGKIESGLCKMAAIGLGKLAGAQQYHGFGYRLGMERVIRSVFDRVAASGKILGGVAILEDANEATAELAVLDAEDLVRREEELLAKVKSWMGRIPVGALDILIVDEIGKNISGTGMDTKVVNRSTMAGYNCFATAPHVGRIFVRDLAELSCGNALGIGLADVVSDRVLEKTDWNATYLNSLTSCIPASSRTPVHFPTDRECLERIALTVGEFQVSDLTIGWITNTMNLRQFAFSENLLPELRDNPALRFVSGPMELPFSASGNLTRLEDLK